MFQRYRSLVLRGLKVPPDPHPPFGDPASLRVFRAGKNYFKLRLFGWAVGQLAALAGIIFWLVVFLQVENAVRQRRLNHQAAIVPTDSNSFADFAQRIGAVEKTPDPVTPKTDVTSVRPSPGITPLITATPSPAAKSSGNTVITPGRKPRPRVHLNGWAGFRQLFVELALWLPLWAFPVLWALKLFGIALYLFQIPLTYTIRRLDFEMHWYIVTDRSLRIRTGLVRLQETTMSFANLQQVEVKQGPLQRALGLADVHVQSAGGGGDQPGKHIGEQLHTGVFHSVNNANEIRDLILERLRRFRQAGLGDPDDPSHPPVPATAAFVVSGAGSFNPVAAADDPLTAAQEMLAEVRALRRTLA